MFDIGFSELIVCALVALVVIGPERMPEAVRSVGLWIGRLKRSLRETRAEIERQIGVDDIRRQLHNEEILQRLEEARRELDEAVSLHHNDAATQNHNTIQNPPALEANPQPTPDYPSEPDLPYHSHLDEPTTAPVAEAPAQGSKTTP